MRYLPGNAQHIGSRSSQQDSFGFGDPEDQSFTGHGGFLAIVCDGMGGMEHGDAASRAAVRAFLESYAGKDPAEPIPSALERAVHAANEGVLTLARQYGLVEGIGTTLAAVAVKDSSLYFVSVGDSGIFHVSGGQIITVNRPHVFANYLDQAVALGQITMEAALSHPERESLTSYIGAETLEEIDRNNEPWPLRDGDTVLLASDGMFKTLNMDEMVASLQGNPPQWPELLVRQTLSKQREYQDNVTVISVTVESEARAALPRTVLKAPPPPAAAGVPQEAPELPRTVMLPFEPAADVEAPPPLPGSPMPPPTLAPPPMPPAVANGAAAATPAPLVEPLVSAMDLPVPAAPAIASPPVAPPVPKPKSSLIAAIALLALAAAGAGWWFWTHRTAAHEPITASPVSPEARPAAPPPADPQVPALGQPSNPPLTPATPVGKPPLEPAPAEPGKTAPSPKDKEIQ